LSACQITKKKNNLKFEKKKNMTGVPNI